MAPQPDADQARIIVHIDPDLEAIVPGFLANRRRDLVTLDGCLKQGDLNTIRILGHRMKGDGGGYGFDQISAIGGDLEQAVMVQDEQLIERQVALLKDFLSRVEVVYTR
ncbi:MAG: hypothetical protein ABS70_04445 [Nitrospira sp. SCN 59-13]|nr:MAG: hypothetical protein ABS70_04445 [Nitrospira sp. SCN 59-13]